MPRVQLFSQPTNLRTELLPGRNRNRSGKSCTRNIDKSVGGFDAISEPGLHPVLPEVDAGLGVAHRLFSYAPVDGDGFHEYAVKGIDLGLEVGAHLFGQRLGRIAVDLVISGMDVGDGDPLFV